MVKVAGEVEEEKGNRPGGDSEEMVLVSVHIPPLRRPAWHLYRAHLK